MRSRLLLLMLAGVLAVPPSAAADPAVAGSGKGPDTLFPLMGNGGYDVLHYGVRLRYRPGRDHLVASVRVQARATRPLSSFHLDLEGLRIRSIRVDGSPATWRRHRHEVVVTPSAPVTAGFVTRVRYAGSPRVHVDPDHSEEGLVPTADGAVALDQPVGAVAWLPSNDYLGDKATWTFRVNVPRGLVVAANGLPQGRRRHGPTTTWRWVMPDPMPPELATVAIGHYRVHRSIYRSVTGREVPIRSYVDPSYGPARHARATLPRVLAFEERYFGPYPLSAAGLVVDDAKVGYAIETMTRPFYPDVPRDGLVVHEMAHQWFGDSLTPTDWHDIWLNEGFAEYAQWLWWGQHGGHGPAHHFASLYRRPADDPGWQTPVRTFVRPARLFGDQSYDRGAMTLQALRVRVGSAAFFRIIRTWATEHRGGTVSTPQFVALAERISGQQLDTLFHDWLDVAGKPRGYGGRR